MTALQPLTGRLPSRRAEAGIDSPYAWARLIAAVLAGTMSGIGMWSVVVTLPVLQLEFGASRASASLAYAATMAGFAVGGMLMGKLADRFGVGVPLLAAELVRALLADA